MHEGRGIWVKNGNRAAGARFSRTKRGRAWIWIEGTQLGRGKLGFKGCEAGIN